MTTYSADNIYNAITDILSRPKTQVYTKNSKLYLKIPSQDTPISGDVTVAELFNSIYESLS